jgi:EmrB/QacA subfamily drug resistance transporter
MPDNDTASHSLIRQKTQRWTLVATILATGIVFLDSTVVNVALPTIDRQLDAGLSGLQWIVDGYVLTLAALLILGGSLGDRYGRRRVMLIGLVGFGAASVGCGLAPSISWLVWARILQGIAGALLIPGSLALLRATFAEGEARGQAIGHWSGWSGITTVIGPLLGGFLVDAFSWRWVFFINVPIVGVATLLLISQVPESRAREARSLDWAGAGLVTLGLGGLAYGLIEGPVVGWDAPLVIGTLLGGVLVLILFVWVEQRVRYPMVPLDLFRSRNFSAANLTTLGVYFALYGTTFFLVLYVQNVMGYSALEAGLVLAPISLLMLVLSPFFGRLAGRHGPRWPMTAGPLAIGLGLLLFTRIQPDSSYWTGLLPPIVVFGLGLASTVAPLTDTVVSAVPDQHSGVAAAFNNAVSRGAALLAIALLGVVVATTFQTALAPRAAELSLSPAQQQTLAEAAQDPTGAVDVTQLPSTGVDAVNQAYTQALHGAMMLCAVMAILGGLVAVAIIRNPPGTVGGGSGTG